MESGIVKVDEPILIGIRNQHILKEGMFYDNVFDMLAFEKEIHFKWFYNFQS
jgi:hypothetical protein